MQLPSLLFALCGIGFASAIPTSTPAIIHNADHSPANAPETGLGDFGDSKADSSHDLERRKVKGICIHNVCTKWPCTYNTSPLSASTLAQGVPYEYEVGGDKCPFGGGDGMMGYKRDAKATFDFTKDDLWNAYVSRNGKNGTATKETVWDDFLARNPGVTVQ